MLTKMVDGIEHPARDFAYVPDPQKPSTWKLPVFDKAHADMAVAALGHGFMGYRVQIPEWDVSEVVENVRKAWLRFHPAETAKDFPLAA